MFRSLRLPRKEGLRLHWWLLIGTPAMALDVAAAGLLRADLASPMLTQAMGPAGVVVVPRRAPALA